MSTKQRGIGTNTYQRILMGPGAVYTGVDQASLLGATMGGNVLEITRTFRDIRPDGAQGPVKGFRWIEEVDAVLTVRLVEITQQALVYALAGSSLSSEVITGGEIANATYLAAVSIIAEITGVDSGGNASVAAELSNVLVEGPLTINLPENGETAIELKFRAHYDVAALTTEPWKLTFTHPA
jgi:hypothetical protein